MLTNLFHSRYKNLVILHKIRSFTYIVNNIVHVGALTKLEVCILRSTKLRVLHDLADKRIHTDLYAQGALVYIKRS